MEKVKTLAKNRWVWVIALAAVALASGGAYSDQLTQVILMIMGQA